MDFREKIDSVSESYEFQSVIDKQSDYLENFDILETINNVGNDEVFTPRVVCDEILDLLPDSVWCNPNLKWLNPASKNGVFEREIAIRLDNGLKSVIPDEIIRRKHIIQEMIFSFGLTRFTASVTRRTLYYCVDANRACDGLMAPDGHYLNGFAIGDGTWFKDAEGNVKTPSINHKFLSDKKCLFCPASSVVGKYSNAEHSEHYAYEFTHIPKEDFAARVSARFFRGDTNMKFDIVIGNPPYQLNDGGGTGSSAVPIYQNFVERAKLLRPKYICMVIPSRWMAGGRGLEEFRKSMMSARIARLVDFCDSHEVFPDNDIKGGVCYFLIDRDHSGDCLVTTRFASRTGKIQLPTVSRPLRPFPECDVFVRPSPMLSVLKKVIERERERERRLGLTDSFV